MLARMFDGRPIPDIARLSSLMLWSMLHTIDDDTRRDAELAYDAEVASIDATLKGVFAELKRRELLQRSIVIFTADHGEEFHEHGGYGHRTTLYNELIHVPLIVMLPGQSVGRRIPDVVSLVDLAPTILDLIGIARPSTFEGHTLRSFFADDTGLWSRLAFWRRPPEPRAAFSEIEPVGGRPFELHAHATSIVLGTHKLIVNRRGETELYDLASDPGERTALAGEGGAELRRRLADFIRQPDGTSPGRRVPLDEETERRLHALGYLN
jgi:arylsulfatase A-like enzyme